MSNALESYIFSRFIFSPKDLLINYKEKECTQVEEKEERENLKETVRRAQSLT